MSTCESGSGHAPSVTRLLARDLCIPVTWTPSSAARACELTVGSCRAGICQAVGQNTLCILATRADFRRMICVRSLAADL
jgi:hypothetical protein